MGYLMCGGRLNDDEESSPRGGGREIGRGGNITLVGLVMCFNLKKCH